ncbi:MAG: BolA family transcriptional regulator [Rhizobiaceae bacterium]|nr:BolA family transcriptional regulator [Rhizobiaceae bacterium]
MYSRDTIETKLKAAFSPQALSVVDESHLHAGHHHGASTHHEGFDGSAGTHFRVSLVAEAFVGLSRVDRHRAVNAALRDELDAGVHALAIEAKAPGEPLRR